MIATLDERAEALPSHDCTILDLSEVTPAQIKWLWPGRIPLGMYSLMAGQPGVGKSTIALSIAAIVSAGGKWPLSNDQAEPGHVIIMTAEDDPKYTLVPRLMAADANLTRISVIKSVMRSLEDNVVDTPLLLSEDMHQLHGVLDQYEDTRLLMIDPLSAYLGAKDSHRDSDVRQVLGPLTDLAAKHEVSILGITHLNKAAGNSAIARFMGSTGIIAAARAAFLATWHDDDLLLLPVKSNVAPGNIGGLIYEIQSRIIVGDIETSCIEWTGQTNVDANDVLSQQRVRTRSPKLMDAMNFIEEKLINGPQPQESIVRQATDAGISGATLRRAREELGIESEKNGFQGTSHWNLPGQWAMKTQEENQIR